MRQKNEIRVQNHANSSKAWEASAPLSLCPYSEDQAVGSATVGVPVQVRHGGATQARIGRFGQAPFLFFFALIPSTQASITSLGNPVSLARESIFACSCNSFGDAWPWHKYLPST